MQLWRWISHRDGDCHPEGSSHSHHRVQTVDHSQGVLLLVEIVGFCLKYRVQRLVPSLGQRFGTGEVACERRFAGGRRQKIERTRVVEVLLSLRTPQSTEKAA